MAGPGGREQALVFAAGYRCEHCGATARVADGLVSVPHAVSCPRRRTSAGTAGGAR